MPMKVMLAFSNLLFSEGIARLLEDDKNLHVDMLKGGMEQQIKCIESNKPDIVLLDIITLYNVLSDVRPTQKMAFILVDTGCSEENIISAFMSGRLSGILMANANSTLLRKAIAAVAGGEIWIDNKTIKNLLTGLNSVKKGWSASGGSIDELSKREKEIIHLVSLGCRNKEIASRLYISEPTIKTHLYRIFQKLNIQNRHQLIAFAMKNNYISNLNPIPKTKASSLKIGTFLLHLLAFLQIPATFTSPL